MENGVALSGAAVGFLTGLTPSAMILLRGRKAFSGALAARVPNSLSLLSVGNLSTRCVPAGTARFRQEKGRERHRRTRGAWCDGGWPLVRSVVCTLAAILGVSLRFAPAQEQTTSPLPRVAGLGSFVVTQVPVRTAVEKQPSPSGGMLPARYGQGARILLISPGRTPRLLSSALAGACDPDVSFDGKRVLLAGKRTPTAPWNIYEINLADGRVHQITRDLGDCRSPGYQPSMYYYHPTESQPYYHITFVSNAAGELNEYGSAAAWHLYGCRLDGSDVRRLTYNLSSDVDPCLMWDGRLVYASWQRRTLEHGVTGRVSLLGVSLDGGDCAPYVAGGKRIKQTPCATANGLLVFVESDRLPWDGAGTLACVTVRRPLHSYRPVTTEADGLYHCPSPLGDGRILVSRRPADGTGNHAVYCLDPATKRQELVYDDPRYHNIQAKAVAPRSEPEGRSSPCSPGDPHGKLYCLNVYTTQFKDRTWMPPGSAKTLRLLEGIPRKGPAANQGDGPISGTVRSMVARKPGQSPSGPQADSPISGTMRSMVARKLGQSPKLARRRILGEVPVAQDGSFNVEVPANTPIELQMLDEQGIALRSCGWVWTKNHFNQGCVGCHEDPELVPENLFVASLEKPATVVSPPPAERHSVDFRHDVMPILAKKCLSCHGKDGSPPDLVGGAPRTSVRQTSEVSKTSEVFAYETLLAPDPATPTSAAKTFERSKTSEVIKEQSIRGRYVDPGRARTSPLVWHLYGRNTSRPWDGDAASRAAKPIPPAQSEPLSDVEKQRIVKWIDLGAAWDSGPAAASVPSSRGDDSRREP